MKHEHWDDQGAIPVFVIGLVVAVVILFFLTCEQRDRIDDLGRALTPVAEEER